MNEAAPIALVALALEAEWPGLVAGAEQLSDCLGQAAARSWPVRLERLAPDAEVPAARAPTAIIVSLLAEAERVEEPFGQTEARWRGRLIRLLDLGAPVFVRTVFRHIADRANAGTVSPVLERIRRLNLMAAQLSNELGAQVIDIDRAFAHIGARALQSDYRMGGVLAAEVAGHTAAWSLLSGGLDEAVDPELQDKAKAVLGGLQQINQVVSRRLSRHRGAARG
jgi:hypothetical protein